MTTSTSIGGLVSGLDTTTLISKLMSLESGSQTLLKSKLATVTSYSTSLQSLNTAVAGIAASAKAASAANALASFTTSSSATSVTATSGTGATAGAISFSVDAVAKSQTTVLDAMTAWPTDPATLTIKKNDGSLVEVSGATTNIEDVVSAINASGAGVTAAKVSAGTDSSGTAQFRIQLQSSASGAAGSFALYSGAKADVQAAITAGTATALGTQISTAQDAKITLWSGTAAAQTVSSSTNTFADVLPDVDVTVSQIETTPVTVTTANSSSAASSSASGLMASLVAMFSGIAANTATTTTTTNNQTTVKGGVFTGDATIRTLKNAMLDAVTDPVNEVSPSTIGISITKTGTIEFDSAKFDSAMASDPAGTTAMYQAITARIDAAATGASDKYDGYITSKITGQADLSTSINDQIASWDIRLATRQATLEKQYAALETSLSSLKSQGDYLTTQLAGLSDYSS